MKLRNKRTGEIVETDFSLSISVPDEEKLYGCDTYTQLNGYNSIAELTEDWEDYEEKDHWYINYQGEVYVLDPNAVPEYSRNAREIGNYFETKEEAELAVRKLKAWKRLKEAGFEFINFPYKKICKYDARTGVGNLEYQVKYYEELETDLDICFGGEE